METNVSPNKKESGKITIGDVADALGISKTTVSRAISGKGRIGQETRERVMAYIKEHDYQPSPIAKGLAKSRTYNIGWVMPGDSTVTDLPFFQRCMMGISEIAALHDYDVLITLVFDHDISRLEKVVRNHKVDGVILGRTLVEDERIAFLNSNRIPFVTIGSTDVTGVIQIDNNHIAACKELTNILIMKGIRKLALIGGDAGHVVNRTRRIGFEAALEEQNIPVNEDWIYMNSDSNASINHSVDEILHNGAECIVCMDDRICYTVLEKLRKDNISVPGQIKVASFYNSQVLANNQPPITALQYDPKELGREACKILFDSIKGEEVAEKTLLSYEVVLKGSTL